MKDHVNSADRAVAVLGNDDLGLVRLGEISGGRLGFATFPFLRLSSLIILWSEQKTDQVGFRLNRATFGQIRENGAFVLTLLNAAAELGQFNVNVNLVAPGFVETPSQMDTPELIRDLVLKECAIKRLGVPEDIAPAVVFLCSDAARHITGQVIKVDAGQYL